VGTVEAAGPDAAMPGAEDFVSDFEAAGLRFPVEPAWKARDGNRADT